MKIYLIRHALSVSNMHNIWTGQTDVDLSEDGIREQREICGKYSYPKAELCVSSPLRRCTHSLEIIYGKKPDITMPKFMECSLGILEGRSYTNLNDDPNYISWIGSPDTALPGGESFSHFTKRAEKGFSEMLEMMRERRINSASVMLHGNVMRAILHRFADTYIPHSEWKIPNGGLYKLDLSDDGKVLSYTQEPYFLFSSN